MSQLHPNWRDSLSRALSRLLRQSISSAEATSVLLMLETHRLVDLDPLCRFETWSYYHRPDTEAETWRLPWQDGADAIDAYLFHEGCSASGYRRQRASMVSRDHRGALSLPLALIRCDDWVDAVRECAEETLRLQLSEAPEALFAHLELLAKLVGRQRIAAHAWPRYLAPTLLAPAHRERRWSAMLNGNGKIRRLIAECILDAEPERAQALALFAIRQRDPVFARWALHDLPSKTGCPLDDETMALARRHPNASVRTHALRLRLSRRDDALAEILRQHLTDRFGAMRALAAFHAPAHGIDPRTVWREAIDRGDSPSARHALASLCERPEAEDHARLSAWTQHPVAETRRDALSGLARIDPTTAIPYLRAALRSPSAKEVRLALHLGALAPRFIHRDTLAPAYAEAANEDSRRCLLHAIGQLWPWDALDTLLDCLETATRDGDPLLAQTLAGWRGALIGKLDPQRKAQLLARIDTVWSRSESVPWARIRAILAEG